MRLGFTELRRSPGKFGAVAGAIGFIVFLALILAALSDGLYLGSTGAYRSSPADRFVFAAGSEFELEGSTIMRIDRAVTAWQHVLELDPTDFRALAALETLYTQEGRWEECVDVLERRVQALASPEDQVDVLMQVANIWVDKIGDGGAAIEVYERIQRGFSSRQVEWAFIGRGHGRDVAEPDGTLRGATGTSEVFVRAQFAAWLRYMTQ